MAIIKNLIKILKISPFGGTFCLFVFCLLTGLQAAETVMPGDSLFASDGPYILYEPDGAAHVVSVSRQGEIKQEYYAGLADDYSFEVVSHSGKHRFQVQLHPIAHPQWKYEQPEKVFVMSDPHGDLDCFVNLLQANKVIDRKYHWTFGSNQLVIIGDVFDRGDDVLPIFWLIYQLEEEARRAGGNVSFLLGNHETLVLMNDLRYVTDKYLSLADKLGVKYGSLFRPASELGRWLCMRNTMQQTGPYLFVHAGISRAFLEQDFNIPEVNELVSRGLYKTKSERKSLSPQIYFLFGNQGPLWYRGMVRKDDKYHPLSSDALDLILRKYAARRVIVGHTIFDSVSTFYGGRVIGVNVDNEENREARRSRGVLITVDGIYTVGDEGVMRRLLKEK